MTVKWEDLNLEYGNFDFRPGLQGMPLAEIEVNDHDGAPVADHNMPCPVCGKKKAMLFLNTGRFHPCCDCTCDGWVMIRLPSWVLRWFPFLRSEIQQ